MNRPAKMLRNAAVVAALAPLVRAGAAGLAFDGRSAIAQRRGDPLHPNVPTQDPTLQLAASVALDELFVMPMGVLTSVIPVADYDRSSAELDEAVRFYEANGWLDDPTDYFLTPPPLEEVDISEVRRRRGPVEVLRFASEWEPHAGEPGGDRWRSFRANREAIAYMLRHDDGPRPWLVYLHGAGLGRLSDVERSRLRRVHHDLGVNVLFPVLPLHAQRREGMRSEQQFVSNVHPANNVLGLAQSLWDIRRMLSWLRQHEAAPGVGVYGFSLGSYVASLLSTIDADLAFVLAVVPGGDLAESLRVVEPTLRSKREAHRRVHDWRSALAHRVVSPLARPCLVPKERRFIVAGVGDQVAPPPGAVLLWRHWDEPDILWRPRGHLTTARSSAFDDHLAGILERTGVAVSATHAR